MALPKGLDIGAFTSTGNRYGNLNQDYVQTEVWRPGPPPADAPHPAAAQAPPPPLLIGAVLDGHGLLGESAASAGGLSVVKELRRLVTAATACATPTPAPTPAAPADGQPGPPGGPAAAAGRDGAHDRTPPHGLAHAVAAATAPRTLEAIPEAELCALVDAAFQTAHASALEIYDDPPRTASYPDSRTGAPAVYCLQSKDGLHLYGAPQGSRSAGPAWRPLECGATCTVALLQGGRLVVGNVGDSSAVLGSLDEDGGVRARLLTFQHCGLHPEEAARISEGYGATVRILPQDGYMAVSGGFWAGYQLSVTRALGHKHMETFGVLHKPSVTCVDLRPEDCCVVLASDGVWDVMDPSEVVNRCMDALTDGKSAAEAARQLVEDAVALAVGSPSGDADNTSAVVIALPASGV